MYTGSQCPNRYFPSTPPHECVCTGRSDTSLSPGICYRRVKGYRNPRPLLGLQSLYSSPVPLIRSDVN